jgi:hypothetical protein
MSVGCRVGWLFASSTTLQHHSALAMAPIFQNLPCTCMANHVMMNPYAHPHHIKVLKHLIYIQCGCEMQSGVVYSLKQDMMISFGFTLTKFHKFPPQLHGITMCGCLMCPSTAYKRAQLTHPIWVWDAEWGVIQP